MGWYGSISIFQGALTEFSQNPSKHKLRLRNVMLKKIKVLFCSIILITAGCVATPKAVKRRLFFPPPPDEPKVEFVGAYQSEHNFPKSKKQLRLESLVGKKEALRFVRPIDIASNGNGKVYVSDIKSRNVIIYDMINYKVSLLSNSNVFQGPVGLALDREGNLYVTDVRQKSVLVFDKNNKPLFSFGKGVLEWPNSIAVDSDLGRIYVTDARKHNVMVFDKKGKYISSMGRRPGKGEGEFNYPVDVEVAPDGSIVVAEMMNARIQIFDSTGKFMKKFGRRGADIDRFGRIKGIGIDNEGHIYISDALTHMLKVYDMDGNFLLAMGGGFSAGKGLFAAAGFNLASGVDVDDNNNIYIVDQENKLFQIFRYLDKEYLKKNPITLSSP
jgi:DNA-binding beta-propeller fold protein YncE